jgi:Na+-transporting methylmalonyl-CoA/oxaloacetate decarboxylase gamma subunit
MSDTPRELDTDAGHRWTPTGVALLVAVIAIIAMWVYILGPWRNREVPTTLEDLTYAERVEPVCAAAQARVEELPPAATAANPQERAEVLDEANDIVAGLVADLHEIDSVVAADRQFVDQWMADWESYLQSRREYASVLASGRDERFTVQAENGHPITQRMDGFADLNDMPSCFVPLDV